MKPQMTPYLSDKMKVLSLIAITMVIYIHTYYTEGERYPVFMALQRFVGGIGLSNIANPLFYLTSGYLFFMGMKNAKECFPKIKKRIRTLLIPYILANTIAFILYALLDGISRLSTSLYSVINFHILDWFKLDSLTILKNVYWEPVAFQLWFVRDMMFFVLLSPLVFFILKWCSNKKWISWAMVFTILSFSVLTGKLVLWMAVGGLIAISDVIDFTKYNHSKATFNLMYICGIIFIVCGLLHSMEIVYIPSAYSICGVVATWLLYDKIAKGRLLCANNKMLATACSYTFFIYLVHEPVLLIFKKIPLLISSSEWMLTICFLCVPPIFVAIAICIGVLLRRFMPKALSWYMGGR